MFVQTKDVYIQKNLKTVYFLYKIISLNYSTYSDFNTRVKTNAKHETFQPFLIGFYLFIAWIKCWNKSQSIKINK